MQVWRLLNTISHNTIQITITIVVHSVLGKQVTLVTVINCSS